MIKRGRHAFSSICDYVAEIGVTGAHTEISRVLYRVSAARRGEGRDARRQRPELSAGDEITTGSERVSCVATGAAKLRFKPTKEPPRVRSVNMEDDVAAAEDEEETTTVKVKRRDTQQGSWNNVERRELWGADFVRWCWWAFVWHFV